jgi:hypothetical protein
MPASPIPEIRSTIGESQDSQTPVGFEATAIALLSPDEEGSQTPKRQNLASTANPAYLLEYLSLSFSDGSAGQTKPINMQAPKQSRTPDGRAASPAEAPTHSSSSDDPLPAPAIKKPDARLKTSTMKRRPSAAVSRKMAQLQVQRERQRQGELDELFVMYGHNPDEIKRTDMPPLPNEWTPKIPGQEQDIKSTAHKPDAMGSKKVTSPISPHPPRAAVKFLADPNVEIKGDHLLLMPGLDENEDFTPSRPTKLSYKKSTSIVSLGEDNIKTHEPRRASMPNMPNTGKQTMLQEAEQMAEAQKSLESLTPAALQKLIKLLAVEKGKTSTNMKELMDNNPPGCFVVESDPGIYHLLEPKTLAMFVATNSTSQRTHVVGKVTIHKEEEETSAVKTLNEVAGKMSKKDRIIYEV